MYGYLKARPSKREVFAKEQRPIARRSSSVNLQTAGSISWEGISYFFGRLWTNGSTFGASSTSPPPCKKLVETQVDSDLIKEQKRQVLRGLLGVMGDTEEYTVNSFDTLPRIALKFDVTPSELSRLNKLAIRTLYPGQVLRVPCSKPTEDCSECSEAAKEHAAAAAAPQSMTMNSRHEMQKIAVAKRVSFDDIDEDVLETFIKIKSKYITDGQGVVKGILLITPHSVIFHPDVSEILVVDRGSEFYKVHFTMQNVCSAGMFDDIASMVVHETLQPGHFFLDKPLMEWLGDPGTTKQLEKIKEEDSTSSSTLHPSSSLSDPSFSPTHPSMSLSQEHVDSLSETTESIQTTEGAPVSTSLDTGPMDICSDVSKQQTSNEEMNIENNLQDNTVSSSVELLSNTTESIEQDKELSEDMNRTSNTSRCSEQAMLHSDDVILSSIDDVISKDDVILSSSNDPSLVKNNFASSGESEQIPHVTSTEPALQYSTPKKLGPYQEVSDTGVGVDEDKQKFIEGISRDSGIHESSEDVDDGSMDQNDSASSPKEIVPRLSTCHVDMPKYLCVKIKKSCWREHRPVLCNHAHKAIQEAIDERREFWFSIPSDRLLEVYGFFLEWCPAIHEGDTDDEKSDLETDFVGSLDSEYSVLTIPKSDDEEFEVVDNFYSKSPEKENHHHHHGRKRSHSREKKKKKKSEPAERERKASSWSTCSLEEPMLPEVIGKSEILTEAHILQLSQCLPSRTIGHSWRLIYSTYLHGISLKTLYRTLAEYDTPALLVILDDSHQIFGTFASSPFAVSEHFYGTGECFLYSFHPHFKAFRWSGENNFFIKGDMDALAFGGGTGNFGLWLDEDLYHGSSHCCKTYNNEPLTVKEDFLCSGLEIWCFE